jgi:hypothetical protein
MTAPTFRYGQVLWALWHLVRQPGAPATVPAVFKARLVRLLATDRKRKKKPGAKEYAFLDQGPVGKGGEVAYSLENAFCLAFGLALMDLGLNQMEVVDYIQGHKVELVKAYRLARDEAAIDWNANSSRKASTGTGQASSAASIPSRYVFVRIAKLSEAHGRKPKRNELGVTWDVDHASHSELAACMPKDYSLALNPSTTRPLSSALLIEIGRLANLTEGLLRDAPFRRRGRP